MKIRLQKPSKKNISEIFALNKAVQGNPWSLEAIESEIQFTEGFQSVAVDEADTLRGYFFARPSGDGAELLMIGVEAQTMRQGIGKRLINELIGELTARGKAELFLEVSHQNAGAIEFYKALGFQIYSVRKGYYSDGSDALCMKLKLANP